MKVAILPLLMAASSCQPDGSGDRPQPESTAQTGDNTPTQQVGGEAARGERLTRFTQRARLGAEDSGTTFVGRTEAIAVDNLGRVYVADSYAADVKVFDSTGAFVRTIGRRGSGPGEFVWPGGLTWSSDSTLWILDLANQRYSVYDTAGAHITDRRRYPLGSWTPWTAKFFNGVLVEVAIASGRYDLVAVHPDSTATAPRDTFPFPLVGIPLDRWNPVIYVRSGTTVKRFKVPFAEGFEFHLDEQGHVWVGDTDTYRVFQRTLSGDTIRTLSRDIPGIAVTDEEWSKAVQDLRSLGASFDPAEVPRQKPFFRQIVPAADGGVWLIREGDGSTWLVDVFAPDGSFMGSLDLPLPPDLGVLAVANGKELWIAVRGVLDTPMLLRLVAE